MGDFESHLTYEYHGETAPRSRWIATLLTVLHPTLGYLYVGHVRPALVAAITSIACLAFFLILWTTLGFFPVLPIIVLFGGWTVFSILALLDILKTCDDVHDHYILRGFNHSIVYALVFIGVSLVPLYASYTLATQVIWGMVRVNDASMNPALTRGDVLLVDRLAFSDTTPVRGDLVVLRVGDGPSGQAVVRLGRVLALEGDQVKVQGDTFQVNKEPLARQFFDDASGPRRRFIEHNGKRSYLIASNARGALRSSVQSDPIEVPEGQIFVATDNRAYSSKERMFWTASKEEVLGRPVFILYSSASGELQPQRIGWRVR